MLMCAECSAFKDYSSDGATYWSGLMFLSDERIFIFVDTNGKKEFRSAYAVFNLRSINYMRGDFGDLEFFMVGWKKNRPIIINSIKPYPRSDGSLGIDDMISLIKEVRFNKKNNIIGFSRLSTFDELNSRFSQKGLGLDSLKCMGCGGFVPFPVSGRKAGCRHCGYLNDAIEVVEKMRSMM